MTHYNSPDNTLNINSKERGKLQRIQNQSCPVVESFKIKRREPGALKVYSRWNFPRESKELKKQTHSKEKNEMKELTVQITVL